MLTITVDYDAGSLRNLNYRGIILKLEKEEVFRVKTDIFINDYHTVVDFARKYYKGYPLYLSSSIEHYIYDSKLNLKWH